MIRRNFQNFRMSNRLIGGEDGQAALDNVYRPGEYCHQGRFHRAGLMGLDAPLSRVDGLEGLKAINNDTDLGHIPVMVLTTSSAEADRGQAYETYASSYQARPMFFCRCPP